MKQCSRCKAVKPVDGFYRHPKAKDGLQSNCMDCIKAATREWRARSGARFNELQRLYYARDPDKYRERARVQRRAAGVLPRRERDPERIRAYERSRHEGNPGLSRESSRRYRAKYPERLAAAAALRRAKEDLLVEADVEYMAILRCDLCSYCGADGVSSIDHIEPLRRGGVHGQENLTAACMSCNSSKGTSDLLAFLLRQAQRGSNG